ncbi:uncharacterized protein B0H18DRAFT_229229 [Fomitopsis serialis]|uniref:uncharacterized protein n=1 Tax=Fomitopsis serialis TaxID=139415 RepID=UPI002007D9B5|nr:uncharacterized protein B0H18DRAFT_229229 [Neoantrodia serialis]KAH9912743.1 hypothetical protein B0H18DRAFT_229229 [Neoantrodia serialis]
MRVNWSTRRQRRPQPTGHAYTAAWSSPEYAPRYRRNALLQGFLGRTLRDCSRTHEAENAEHVPQSMQSPALHIQQYMNELHQHGQVRLRRRRELGQDDATRDAEARTCTRPGYVGQHARQSMHGRTSLAFAEECMRRDQLAVPRHAPSNPGREVGTKAQRIEQRKDVARAEGWVRAARKTRMRCKRKTAVPSRGRNADNGRLEHSSTRTAIGSCWQVDEAAAITRLPTLRRVAGTDPRWAVR